MSGYAFSFAPDAAAAAQAWLTALKSERRVSALTLEAYARDLGQFDLPTVGVKSFYRLRRSRE